MNYLPDNEDTSDSAAPDTGRPTRYELSYLDPVDIQPADEVPPNRHSNIPAVLTVFALVVAIVGGGAVYNNMTTGENHSEAQTTVESDTPQDVPIPDAVVPLEPVVSAVSNGNTPSDGVVSTALRPYVSDGTGNYDEEWSWKSGESWEKDPDSKPQPSAFTTEFPDVNVWLKQLPGVDIDMRVVMTDDPAYNCGAADGVAEGGFGGCYNSAYGKVIFLWWGATATDDEKRFVVLHEYSHYIQSWNYFDSEQGASVLGVDDSPEYTKIIETDATCRVFDSWGFDEYRYMEYGTTSPCGDTQWYEGWFGDQISSTYGVPVG